jgi:hypothetical protein
VTYGPPWFLVFPVTSIILLFLMISHTIFGPFHSILNLTPFKHSRNFFAYVKTQFGYTIKSVQCDNGREFDNSTTRTFFFRHGITMRLSCPHNSPQNGESSVLFILLMTVCTLSCFRPAFLMLIGQRLFAPPPIYSIGAPQKFFPSPHHILLYSEFIWISPSYGFLGANATLT